MIGRQGPLPECQTRLGASCCANLVFHVIIECMEQKGNRLILGSGDSVMDRILARISPGSMEGCTFHFSQGEDFFVQLPETVTIPSFPVHHAHDDPAITPREAEAMAESLEKLGPWLKPWIGEGHFFFDPTANTRPAFVEMLRFEDRTYASIISVDLSFHASCGTMQDRGSNDDTCVFSTRSFFLDCDLVPVDSMEYTPRGRLELSVIQNVSDTWIGETGKGYFLQGIWLDRDINKFLSRLAVPPGLRTYPWYPLNCKYRSICYQLVQPGQEARHRALQILHHMRKLVVPNMGIVERALREDDFSEEMDSFQRLRSGIPPSIPRHFESCRVRTYLNEQEMREHEITF